MTQSEALHSLLKAVAAGKVSPADAFDKLNNFAYESVGDFAKIDYNRTLRTGFPEVIWGLDKTPEQITQIIEVMRERNATVPEPTPIMVTRIEPDICAQLQTEIPEIQYYPTARICALAPQSSKPKYSGNYQSHLCWNL